MRGIVRVMNYEIAPQKTEEHEAAPWIVVLILVVVAWAICSQVARAAEPWKRPSWGGGDVAGDGRDTRGELIAERCSEVTWSGGTAATARCRDQYSGIVIFGRAKLFQVDHVYAAVSAWRARAWHQESGAVCRKAIGCSEFSRFFNDKENLQITTARSNESKSDRGPAEWCPALRGARILLAKRYRVTASKWRLPISAEDAIGLAAWSRGECAR